MFTNPFAATQSMTASFAQFQAGSPLSKMMESITAKNDYCGLDETVSAYSAAHKALMAPILASGLVSRAASQLASSGISPATSALTGCQTGVKVGALFAQLTSPTTAFMANFVAAQPTKLAIGSLLASPTLSGWKELQFGQTLGDLMDVNGMLDDILRRAKPPKINTVFPRSRA